MAFNSFNFWLVFPLIFLIYWAIPSKYIRVRNGYMLALSYLLYMNWRPSFAIVLVGVTLVTYIGAILCEKQLKGKLICVIFTVLAIFPLLVFKYSDFVNESLTAILNHCGLHLNLPGLNWAIPVGISFFTFQAVGYLLDVFHQRVPAEKNLLDYALFVGFFPQIASGPISTAKDLLPQFKSEHRFNYKQGRDGLQSLLCGMFLKCVLADRLGLYADTAFAGFRYLSGANCFIASVCYSIQIYGDFAGYSLMAVGIAKLLGFNLVNNFNRPYFAVSISDFWKRWHISLTRWLTTHIYINLGGNRHGRVRQYLNILVTFLVSGLWHGANWTFVVWGGIHGLFQIFEKFLGVDAKGRYFEKINSFAWLKPLRILATFLLVTFSWIFFRMPTITDAWDFIIRIFQDRSSQKMFYGATNSDILYMVLAVFCVFVTEFRQEFLPNRMKWLDSKTVRWVIYILAFCMILNIGVLNSSSFIYVSF